MRTSSRFESQGKPKKQKAKSDWSIIRMTCLELLKLTSSVIGIDIELKDEGEEEEYLVQVILVWE